MAFVAMNGSYTYVAITKNSILDLVTCLRTFDNFSKYLGVKSLTLFCSSTNKSIISCLGECIIKEY